MLQSPITLASNQSLLDDRRRKTKKFASEEFNMDDDMYDDDFEGGDSGEHFTHPYPTPQDQAMLMQKTGIDKKQLKNWFTNARRRIWKPMLKKQIEQGKISATAPSAFSGMQVNGANPGASMDNPHSVQAVRVHYQQAMQDQNTRHTAMAAPLENYGNPIYTVAHITEATPANYYGSNDQMQLQQCSSIGTLEQLSSQSQLCKTDSHAVLMELFARDQDLVRQATESARLKAESKQQEQPQGQTARQGVQQQSVAPTSQHPMMKAPSLGVLQGVPTLSSWPHFSSITSLNNLGTLPGVKSIASLSGIDLASKGNVNKMGNIAQIKSMESMGKNDSYAFLEVFFGDRSSTNLSGMGGGGTSKGLLCKHHGDEDNEIGLSLEDESPSHLSKKESAYAHASMSQGMAFGTMGHDGSSSMGSGTLKRAYDDALAARGLISVSRSCERLTDLVLPAKIQRTLSQEFINMQQEQQVRHQVQQQKLAQQQKEQEQAYSHHTQSSSHQYPGQQPAEPQASSGVATSNSHKGHVQVSSSTACAMCSQTNIDTQLRPCGHMFHERCLKPRLSNPLGPPKCPIDDIPIHSAVLAIPDNSNSEQQQVQSGWPNQNAREGDATV